MTTQAGNSHPSLSTPDSGSPVTDMIKLVPGPGGPDHEPDRSPGDANHTSHSPASPNSGGTVRPWPLLLLAMPAAVACGPGGSASAR
jgi:hypothetical protein